MALWNSKKKKKSGYSYLAGGASIMGRLAFDGVLRIDGQVIGEIISTGTVLVEEEAMINGTVMAENIVISGTILGDIKIYKHVQVNSTAKIYGHISYGALSMVGAIHEGRCHKLTPDEVAAAQQHCVDILSETDVDHEDYIPTSEVLEQYAQALDKADRQATGILTNKELYRLVSYDDALKGLALHPQDNQVMLDTPNSTGQCSVPLLEGKQTPDQPTNLTDQTSPEPMVPNQSTTGGQPLDSGNPGSLEKLGNLGRPMGRKSIYDGQPSGSALDKPDTNDCNDGE